MELLSNINILAGRQVCMCVRVCVHVCVKSGVLTIGSVYLLTRHLKRNHYSSGVAIPTLVCDYYWHITHLSDDLVKVH